MAKTTTSNQLYELAVLYRQQPSESEQTQAAEAVKRLIVDEGGQIKTEDNWGVRSLSYPIKHQEKAVYVFYNIDIPGKAISKLGINLNINPRVLRHLISKVDHKRQAKAKSLADRQAQRQPPEAEAKDNQESTAKPKE